MNNSLKNAKKVFKALCEMTYNFYGVDIFSAASIAQQTGLSKYSVFKALHILRDYGYVTNSCVGRPAIVEGFEYPELVCEAMPPYHGFSLTSKGAKTLYNTTLIRKHDKELTEWLQNCEVKTEGGEENV